jgi:hypothetical protein
VLANESRKCGKSLREFITNCFIFSSADAFQIEVNDLNVHNHLRWGVSDKWLCDKSDCNQREIPTQPKADGDGLLKVASKSGTDVIYAGTSTSGNGLLKVKSKSGTDVIYAGATTDGDGVLMVKSKSGTDLIYAGTSPNGGGFLFEGYNKTGEGVVQLYADDYGNGVVGAYNRKGKGKTLQPGP